MPGFKLVSEMVLRELNVQKKLATDPKRSAGISSVLNIPLVLGPVGLGKSAMALAMADKFALRLVSINCGENSDPTDVSGIPVPVRNKDSHEMRLRWLLNEQAMQACSEPALLFADDFDKAPPTVQGAFLSIAGNRTFRDVRLHKETLIMAAGNRVNDDEYANTISESIRTRMTTIELTPNLKDFVTYGRESGEIHDSVLGYLMYKPDSLHKHDPAQPRFPTPRGWWEVSRHFEMYPDPQQDLGDGGKDAWRLVVGNKCGQGVGNEFWAWHTLLREVDVQEILVSGHLPKHKGKKDNEVRMAEFAAICAVSQYLNQHGVKPKYKGLGVFVKNISPELKVAFLAQISQKVRSEIASKHPEVANDIVADLLQLGPQTAAQV